MLRNPFKELDANIRKRSSDLLKTGFNVQKIVNSRARILITGVFVCFLVIAGRLVYIQLIAHEDYQIKLENFTKKNITQTTPRGVMTDRNGNILVDNQSVVNITYYPEKDLSRYSEKKWKLANKFANQFGVQAASISKRDWKDYYLVVADDAGLSLLSDEEQEQYLKGVLKESAAYAIKISRITEDMIQELRSQALSIEDQERGRLSNEEKYVAWPVMFKMEQATQLSRAVIIEDADENEIAYLIEHNEEFVGFDITIQTKRVYPYGSVLRDVFGSVSINGLTEEEKDYYLSLGYSLNDNVGISGLEKQYEQYLSGTRTIKEISYDEYTGSPIFTTIQEGKKGYDMQLTIDIDLQQKADAILQKTLTESQNNPYRQDFKEVFFAMMDPNTGEILTMSGQRLNDDGSFTPYASGNYLSAFLPGSTAKLSTLYMGLNEGVVKPGEIILDAPMYFKGGLVKQSYTNKGLIDDVEAIRQSSNVYMFHIAIRLGGGYYTPYGALYLPDVDNAYETYRKYFTMFGLGTRTYVDVPYEETGYAGTEDNEGHLLDYSIGQYESYTPLQLLQYVSTVSTGVKVKPHFMKQIYEINDQETIIQQYGVQVLDTLNGNEQYLDRVREGMRQCVSSGFCGYQLNSLNKDIAAKTGTAEVGMASEQLTNSLIVGYAPADNPKIAFVCVAPNSYRGVTQANITQEIAYEILSEYFKTYE